MSSQDLPLSGKVALVTGAALRIGRSIALELASAGAGIVVHYRDSGENAGSVCKEIESKKVPCWSIQADFEEPGDADRLMEQALKKAGRLDILVNSASIFPKSGIRDVKWEDLLKSMKVNSWTPFILSRLFAEKTKAGAIVNILDTRIRSFDLNHVAYILSKQQLESFTRMTALEFAPGIRVNAVAPGLILPPPGEDESYLDKLVYSVPLKKHGNPGQIAEAVLFLVKSEFITGQIIYVDGGRHLNGVKEHG